MKATFFNCLPGANMPLLDPLLKEILVCPNCHGTLDEDEAALRLRCTLCGLAYPVRDGIPVMLIEEADKPEGFVARQPESAATATIGADNGSSSSE
jgi:uncharacterized protein YbaR (Trm112 family)